MEKIEKEGKVFTLGDIHGGAKALRQCLERSGFNNDTDTLIQLGDVVDGFDQVAECVDELLSIKNLISIKGNHDEWFLQFLKTGQHPDNWQQGGRGTLKSYMEMLGYEFQDGHHQWFVPILPGDIPESHREFFYNQKLYHVDKERNMIFVHGGFNRHIPIDENEAHVFYWDRDLLRSAMSVKKDQKYKMADNWKEVFLGHTATIYWGTLNPIHTANIWDLDTGCGWPQGKLTIMNIDTKEFFQSDLLGELYPGQQSR